VRRGAIAGRAILVVGAVVGAIAVAASYLNVPAELRRTVPLGIVLLAPGTMALCALLCVGFAYQAQQVRDLATFALGDTTIAVRYAPAHRIEADALLLPTATNLRTLGGAAWAVGAAAGPEVERAALAAAPAGMGKVVATEAGRLAGVERIFHAVVAEPLRPVDENSLRRGLENAAQQARKAGAHRVAVPVGALRGQSVEQTAAAAAEALLKHRRAFSEIVFVALEMRVGPAVRAGVERVVSQAKENARPPMNLPGGTL
jgi:O-acetyl-ADP-ribose deacetylase (regulator of RNase III)